MSQGLLFTIVVDIHVFFSVNADPNVLADKVNAVKKYITDITKVAEVIKPS